MTQYLCPYSARQFVDANGNPYSGAKLFTYAAGSSTKVTCTMDQAGSSNHTNPIVLNSRGEIANGAGAAQALWQPGGTALKLVLAPSTDSDPPVSAIETFDNVSGINDTSVSIDQWISGPTPTYVSATSFTLVGDQTSTFHVGRRLKTTNSGGTIYATIVTTAYTTLTTVTVVNDSSSLDSGLSAVSYGLLSATNPAVPEFSTRTQRMVDAGATEGPSLVLDRLSSSPAASDLLGTINFNGRNSAAAIKTYAKMLADIVDATAASEDGRLLLQTMIAGTLATRGYMGNGLVIGSPTGSDKGAGTINASEIYENNVRIIAGAAGGASVALVARNTLSNASTSVFTTGLYSAGDVYIFAFNIRPTAGAPILYFRGSIDGGSTYLSGGASYNGATRVLGANGTTYTTVGAAAQIAVSDSTNGFTNISGLLYLHDTSNGSREKQVYATCAYKSSIGGNVSEAGWYIDNNSNINAVQFLLSANNMDGYIDMYRVLNA